MTNAEQLTNWVASKHEGQTIKRTEEPYFNHVAAVAALAKPAVTFGYEIGLCHDLLEDTKTTKAELWATLLKFGYDTREANLITAAVVELTDSYTSENYPDWSKKERKDKESSRLMSISPAAQTVKYGDLIYNVDWVLKYDQKHAKKYLLKKKVLLASMNKGDQGLLQKAVTNIDAALKSTSLGMSSS